MYPGPNVSRAQCVFPVEHALSQLGTHLPGLARIFACLAPISLYLTHMANILTRILKRLGEPMAIIKVREWRKFVLLLEQLLVGADRHRLVPYVLRFRALWLLRYRIHHQRAQPLASYQDAAHQDPARACPRSACRRVRSRGGRDGCVCGAYLSFW